MGKYWLNHVVFNGLELIPQYAFSNCEGLECISFESVTRIDSYAFKDCTNLTSIDFGTTVETIKGCAFQNCTGLENLYIPDAVKSLGVYLDEQPIGDPQYTSEYQYLYRGPFEGCTGLKQISVGGVETLTTGMLNTGSRVLEKLIIRGTVKNIGDKAFDSSGTPRDERFYAYTRHYYESSNGYNESDITRTELILEEGIETIGNCAFRNCDVFESISLPASIVTIGTEAFHDCSRLSTLYFNGTKQPFVNNSLSNCSMLTVVLMSANDSVEDYCANQRIPCVRPDAKLVLPFALTTIEDEAFQNSVTTWVVLPNTIESIGRLAFADCGKLSRVDIPVASVEIDPEAFANSPRVTIFAPAGGTVQSFAEEHGIRFVAVENSVSPAA